MLNMFEVIETNNMTEQKKSDMRTITMGISLLDYCDNNLEVLNQKIYGKIYGKAKDLVFIGNTTVRDFGIPTMSKRISVTPITLVGDCVYKSPEDFVGIARALDRVVKGVGANFISGYSAPMGKGMTPTEENLIRFIPQALASAERVCSSVNMDSARTGLSMDAVRLMGEIIRGTTTATKEDDSLGCAEPVVFCNTPNDNPSMAGAFHGVTETDAVINVGVGGPGVVKTAVGKARGENFEVLCKTIKRTAFKVTCMEQLVAQGAFRRLGVPFDIIDLSSVPTPVVEDSVAEILEEIGLERAGVPGTMVALAMFNDQVKKGGVMASSYAGGFSGASIPVSEDQEMVGAVTMGILTLERLETMICVCSIGLDMIAIPGGTTATTLADTIADEAAIGMINQKITAARLIPVIGKRVGGTAEFGGLPGYMPVMPMNRYSCKKLVSRGGGIPAPIHSLKSQDDNRIKIYLIRHDRQCSRLCDANVDLCEEEYHQAELVGRGLEHAGTEKLYSSDLLRAIQTAETANRYWNVGHVIRSEPREISFGDMKELSDDVIAEYFAEFKLRQNQILEDLLYPGGECTGDVIQHAMPILLETAQSGPNRVAVVTHGGAIRSIIARILKMNLAKARPIGGSLENCSIAELEHSLGKLLFALERFNNYAYLKQEPELLRYHWTGQENQAGTYE